MRIEAHKKILLAVILSLLLIPLLANIASGDSSLETFKLTAETSEEFGRSVAVSGDTMVVGDPSEEAAYVFESEEGKWNLKARLTDGNDFSFFGWSVAISGDTIVVGAPFESFQGSVYVFQRVGDSWNEDPAIQLTTSDSLPFNASFGWSLAFEGSTLVVGTPIANSVYVFNPDGVYWPQEEAKLTGGDTEAVDRFGWSVAVSGARMVVGAPRDESTAGSAYVFDFDEEAGEWLETKKLTASDKAIRDDFGFSVAIRQDTVVVGAHKNTSPSVSTPGAAYVFEFGGESWNEKAKLTPRDSADYDQFGYSVAIKNGILLVGAPFDSLNGPEDTPGATYVFEADGSIWSEKLKLTASLAGDPPKQDQFGVAVAIDGTTLVAGAILADAEIEEAGAAYLFIANERPVAVASLEDPKELIIEGDRVTLDGSDSYDPDGDQLTYHWEQTGGPPVGSDLLLTGHDPENPSLSFFAPELPERCTELSFTLTVTDDKGLASEEPAIVKFTVYPNNRIYAKLGGKHRHWLYWHKYSFYGHENERVTIRLEADLNGWHRGRRATLMLKDRIKGVRLLQTNTGSLPNEISATLPADGKYTVYVVKAPSFWFWWRHKRHKRFEGDYVLSLEGTCGKLVTDFQCNKR